MVSIEWECDGYEEYEEGYYLGIDNDNLQVSCELPTTDQEGDNDLCRHDVPLDTIIEIRLL